MSDHYIEWTDFRKRRVLKFLSEMKNPESYGGHAAFWIRRELIDSKKLDDYFDLLLSFLENGDGSENRLARSVLLSLPEAHERILQQLQFCCSSADESSRRQAFEFVDLLTTVGDQSKLVQYIFEKITEDEFKSSLRLEAMLKSDTRFSEYAYSLILSKIDMRYLLQFVDCYDLVPKQAQAIFRKVATELVTNNINTQLTRFEEDRGSSVRFFSSRREISAPVSAIRRVKTHRSMLENILGRPAYTNLSNRCAALELLVMSPIAGILNRLTEYQNQYFGSMTWAEIVGAANGVVGELSVLTTEIQKKAKGSQSNELESVLERIQEMKEPFSLIVRRITPDNSLCQPLQIAPKEPFDTSELRDKIYSLWNDLSSY